MGRYDKIKVYDGSNWVQPKRICIRQGSSWVDLGTNDSDNNRELYVYKDTVPKRATLTKKVITHTGHKYKNGDFQAEPTNGYCFCPKSSGAGGYSFNFEGYIKRGAAGSKNIFKSYGIPAAYSASYIYITLNENNTITVSTSCNFDGNGNYTSTGRGNSKTTNIKITEGSWNYIRIWADKGTNVVKVKINSQQESFTGLTYTWLVWSTNYVGAPGLYIRSDGFQVQSVDGNGSSHSYSYVPVNQDESYTETVWE